MNGEFCFIYTPPTFSVSLGYLKGIEESIASRESFHAFREWNSKSFNGLPWSDPYWLLQPQTTICYLPSPDSSQTSLLSVPATFYVVSSHILRPSDWARVNDQKAYPLSSLTHFAQLQLLLLSRSPCITFLRGPQTKAQCHALSAPCASPSIIHSSHARYLPY